MLFSATVSQEVHQVSNMALKPGFRFVDCVDREEANSNAQIQQFHVTIDMIHQPFFLYTQLKEWVRERPQEYKIMVFFPTARVTSLWAQVCNAAGLRVGELHSRKSQAARQRVSDDFRTAKSAILFSSDVSARGMDYDNVTHVVQVGIPSSDEQYVHRLGRTGRAGKDGMALMILLPDEQPFLTLVLKSQPLQPLMTPPPGLDEVAWAKVLQKVTEDRDLKQSAQQAYSSWIGYYNGHLKLLGWDKVTLVAKAHLYSTTLGLTDVPALSARAIGMMGLRGVPGVRVEATQPLSRGRFQNRQVQEQNTTAMIQKRGGALPHMEGHGTALPLPQPHRPAGAPSRNRRRKRNIQQPSS